KLAATGKLAAGIAHEIRNPLSSVRGFAHFLKHSLADDLQAQEYADTIIREVDRINRVVSDLLTFASPLEPELLPTDLQELVKHSVRLVQADAEAREVQLEVEVSAGMGEIYVDEGQLTQALLNLLLNAIQAIGEKGTVRVGARLEQPTSRLHLWVEDNGQGIAAADREKIFDPFYSSKDKGTGLGLAIVHKIVENHQGEIRVESPLPGSDRGSRFTMVIPTDITDLKDKRKTA
ncbi:MAG: hypothetical protein JRI89_13230, partial [Deltaproteobacteria bacterium]|nr:hypothetical protein [Deltaproteobacteria bacterium]